MSEAQHTPGPWYFSQDHGGYAAHPFEVLGAIRGPVRDDAEDYVLATIISDCVPQAGANARLIAASPEIFEALKDLVARCDGDEGVRADGSNIDTLRAHAAIAKAETEKEERP